MAPGASPKEITCRTQDRSAAASAAAAFGGEVISIRAPQSASWPAISGIAQLRGHRRGHPPGAPDRVTGQDVGRRVGDVHADHVPGPDAAPGQPGRGALEQHRQFRIRARGRRRPAEQRHVGAAGRGGVQQPLGHRQLADRCLCCRHGIGEPPARVHRQFRRLRGTAVPLSSVRRVRQDLVLVVDTTLFTSAWRPHRQEYVVGYVHCPAKGACVGARGGARMVRRPLPLTRPRRPGWRPGTWKGPAPARPVIPLQVTGNSGASPYLVVRS